MKIYSGILPAALVCAACHPSAGGGVSHEPALAAPEPVVAGGPAPQLHVRGNRLVDSAGDTIRLRGANRPGTELMCARGHGIFDGPSDPSSVRAIAAWKANAVRVPLNEACWLGIDGVDPRYASLLYRQAIASYVATLNSYGIVAILSLQLAAPGSTLPRQPTPMPNRDHTVELWRQVAAAFRGNKAVLFELFSEPYPDDNQDTPEAWRCWREGGRCAGLAYEAVGMQELVTTVRSAGAANVILLGGVQHSASLSRWQANMPVDPFGNLAAAWHVYDRGTCSARACWDRTALPVSQYLPLIVTELGENDRGNAFVSSLIDWLDAVQGGYLASGWSVRRSRHDLIANYDGTPTPYGNTIRLRLR